MQYIRIALEIIIAILAILGLYDAIRWCCGNLFGSKNYVLLIEILTQREAESAEVLIRDALSRYISLPSVRWAILTLPEFSEYPTLLRAINTYGLTCYVIEPSEE